MIRAIAIDDEPPALSVIESLCRKNAEVQLEKSFTEPAKALQYLKKFPVDLIFCDVQMPSMTGIELVQNLSDNTLVIFTTAHAQYAALSYELEAMDYLLKPINQKRFDHAISRVQEYMNYIDSKGQKDSSFLFVRSDFKLVKIPTGEISYIEGLADYLKIHVENRRVVTVRMTMKSILELLPANKFTRIHRSYIFPVSKIESVRGTTVYTPFGQFPIGRTYAEDFLKGYSK
jgi:DNA-binding LytR/AlgR family response regulator